MSVRRKPDAGQDLAAAKANREKATARSRRLTETLSEAGLPSPPKNPARKKACRLDLFRFLQTYFPNSTGLSPFSEDHRAAISRVQSCALEGGLFVNVFPRGYAKTTLSENAAIWAVLYGHRKFVPIFGADASSAMQNIDSIKFELSGNELLAEDFDEVCRYVAHLEGKPQRAASQMAGGNLTHIEWTAETIVLPMVARYPDDKGAITKVEYYPSSGAVLAAHGLTAASRGLKHKSSDGRQLRPDLAIIDDPQTEESASSPLQIGKRLDIIRKNILKQGAHSKRIAVVVNATVIARRDLIETLLDAKKFPSWQGMRIKMVREWSKVHDSLWMGDYARLRNTYDPQILGDQQRAHRQATEFYKVNRFKMDEGCLVSWPECYDRTAELSAIQHAYNSLIDDGPEVFASECQNEPLEVIERPIDDLTVTSIMAKLHGHKRGEVPPEVSRLTAFIDVQKPYLPWVVCGFTDDFTGFVLDYGTFPDQGKTYFSKQNVRRTLEKLLGTQTLEATIYGGLDRLVGELVARDWKRSDGAILKMERVLIDANWGDSTSVVYQFCRQSPHSAILLPTHGRGGWRRVNESAPKPGERRSKTGPEWRMPPLQQRGTTRYGIFDANGFKTFVRSRLLAPMGSRGCLSLFGTDGETHRLFADHLMSERASTVAKDGREFTAWDHLPNRDNDFWDCLVGCHVGASILGVELLRTVAPTRPRTVKMSERQKTARTWKCN